MKVTVLALFVLSCNAAPQVLEVTGPRVTKIQETHLPLRTVSGISSVSGLTSGLPVSSSYVSGVNPLTSLGLNLGYLSDLRQRVLGSSINIAPSAFSYAPFGQANSLAIRQQGLAIGAAPVSYAISQPSLAISQPSIAIAHQPAIHVARQAHYAIAQPAVSHVAHVAHVAQPALALRPQVLAAQQAVHPVNAAIQQVARTVEYRPVPYSDQPIQAQEVVVEPSDQPINIHFKSRSSTVRISQEHQAGEPGTVEQTQSQDEPSRVQHEVVKPVVQEVREVIQPYRQVTQEIQPVVENVHTVVAHGEGQRAQYVAEPIVRQNLVAVRPAVQSFAVQQPAIQTVAVQQPAVQTLAVQQPALRYVAVAQPAVQAVRQFAVAQPAISAYRQIAVAQPAISAVRSFAVNQPAIQSFAVGAQPIAYGVGVRPYGVVGGQQFVTGVTGVNRVVANNEDTVRTEELREAREEVDGQRGNFVRYSETRSQ